MEMSTGQILQDRYRVVNKLAQGGFGSVYRAWDMNLRAHCAVKENLNASEAVREQFMQEAKILSQLTHPHLPRVTDYFYVPGQGQYLVMDYIEGQDLQQMLDEKGEPLPQARAMQWIYQVCDAVMYLHSQKPPIIHRDIKPANIKVAPDGRAVLVDFGIAKVFDEKSQTVIGAKAVTPGFSPPEQYGKGSTDVRSDVYSLGATLYALLTGEAPPSSVDIISKIVPPPPPPRMRNPSIAPEVSDAVVRAMQMEKQARFPNVAEFRDALAQPLPVMAAAGVDEARTQSVYGSLPAGAPAQPDYGAAQMPAGQVQKRSSFPMVLFGVLLALLLIAVLVIGGFWVGTSGILDGDDGETAGANTTLTAEWLALQFTQTVHAHELSVHATETAMFVSPATSTPIEPAEPTATLEPTFTFTPEPSATPTIVLGPLELTEVQADSFLWTTSGCYMGEGNCWAGTNDQEKTMVVEDIYIDPGWPNPYLVFRHRYNFPVGTTGTITILTDSGEDILKLYPDGNKAWYEDSYSLAKYAGMTITIKFYAPWGDSHYEERRSTSRIWTVLVKTNTEWIIQNLRIETDFEG